jgi:hypothetical protein
MKRTTIFADEELIGTLKHMADEEGISFAELTRQALSKFIAQHRKPGRQLSFLGIGKSGRKYQSQ